MTTVNPKIAASADDGVEGGAGTNAITGSIERQMRRDGYFQDVPRVEWSDE